jgi:predicted Fe-S protein YdhL (DUF1289 family)
MQETKTDVSKVHFTSTVFPTEEDMKLWNSMSPEEQRAVIERDLDAAEASGTAAPESMEQMMQRVRAGQAHDL